MMQLYYHRTDGGAEYYGLDYIDSDNGHQEGIAPFILRTDGDEIEVFADAIRAAGLKLVIRGDL